MFDEIKARRITREELENTTPETPVFVLTDIFKENGVVLAEARILSAENDGGFYPCTSAFNLDSGFWAEDQIHVQDDDGEVFELLKSAGTYFDLGLFFPRMAEEEVREKLFAALRDEFGADVIQLWRGDAEAVPDVLYDVYEVTKVVTGRGKTREEKVIRVPRMTGVYLTQAAQVQPQSGGTLETVPHQPVTYQAPTI